MQKLKRNINMGFRVTEDEKELIQQRMEQTGIRSQRAYILKMAIDGMVLNLDLSEVNECSRLLGIISNNVNQIAKRANETGNIYVADILDIQSQLKTVWQQQDKLIRNLTKILEAV